jgi:hypothetical protein
VKGMDSAACWTLCSLVAAEIVAISHSREEYEVRERAQRNGTGDLIQIDDGFYWFIFRRAHRGVNSDSSRTCWLKLKRSQKKKQDNAQSLTRS